MIVLILLILIVTAIYYLVNAKQQYWQKRGIIGPKPTFFVGNLGESFIFKRSSGDVYEELYNKYPDAPYVGLYRALTPVLMIRDPELVKEVLVKSFNHFHDNDVYIDKKYDPLWGRNVFVLRGEEWKTVRGVITPGFTATKLKSMFSLVESNSKKFLECIDSLPIKKDCDIKSICNKYTTENIASCAFGLEGQCFVDENSQFNKLSRELFVSGGWTSLVFYFSMFFPSLAYYLPIRLINKSVTNTLTNIVSQTLKYREENNIIRNDFLHIMNEMKKSNKNHGFSDVDITAHCAGFFLDGFESSAGVISYILFLLSENPESQNTLRNELLENPDWSYDTIMGLPYLDAVFNETLRVLPILPYLQKVCTETFSKNGLVIEKGTSIVIPVAGLQHDPKYFEEPKKFKPERHLGSNKDNIVKGTFQPVGDGPRACMGIRFGALQVKLAVAQIIKHYELSRSNKTEIPFKFDPANIMWWPLGGIWLTLKKIS